MPQSLLAILSMILTSMYAYTQHQNVIATRLNIVENELSLQSTSVAVDLMEEIGSMAFDEATLSEEIFSPGDLTPIGGYYQGSDSTGVEAGGTDDIDDFNGINVSRTRDRSGHTLSFTAAPVVAYVESDGVTPSTIPTKYKKVTVAVANTDFVMADTVYLSQVFSCGKKCNW